VFHVDSGTPSVEEPHSDLTSPTRVLKHWFDSWPCTAVGLGGDQDVDGRHRPHADCCPTGYPVGVTHAPSLPAPGEPVSAPGGASLHEAAATSSPATEAPYCPRQAGAEENRRPAGPRADLPAGPAAGPRQQAIRTSC
jgi:hypothetical protein